MTAASAAHQVQCAWDVPRDWPMLRQLIEELTQDCAQHITAAAPEWLGHLKTLIVTDEGAAYASITGAGEPLTWRGALSLPASAATITLYAVVWALDDATVTAAVEAALRHKGLTSNEEASI